MESILLRLPHDIWKNEISVYLSLFELSQLRLISKYFRNILYSSPIWKQFVPYNQIHTYLLKVRTLKISIYGVYYERNKFIDLETCMSTIPKNVECIDISKSSFSITGCDKWTFQFPSNIKRFILPKKIIYPKNIGFLLSILELNPLLEIDVGELNTSLLCELCGTLINPEYIKLLLTNSYQKSTIHHKKLSPLDHAIGINKQLVPILLENGTPVHSSLLCRAIDHDDIDSLNLLLKHGVKVNDEIDYTGKIGKNSCGQFTIDIKLDTTPLLFALELNNEAIVQTLLEYGADPNKGQLNKSSHPQEMIYPLQLGNYIFYPFFSLMKNRFVKNHLRYI